MLWMILTLVGLAAALLGGAWFALTQPVAARRPSTPPAPVDPQLLERRVRRLVAFPERSFGYPESLARVAADIRVQFTAAGARTRDQAFRVNGDTYVNVCAELGPDTPARIVVGAHYDAVEGTPGADDNASGVAALLTLAELLAPTPLRHRVELVAFVLEEPPAFGTAAMGSAVHARRLREAGADVIGMLSLEMLGFFSDRRGSQRYPLPLLRWLYPPRGDFIGVVGRFHDVSLLRRAKGALRGASDLPVVSLNGPGFIPGVSLSDHSAYWSQGYTAIMVTDTAFYRNPHYHEETDRPETLDYARLAQVVQGVHAAVLALDESR